MKNEIIIIVAIMPLLLLSAALNGQAAALDRSQDPEQLWNIGWELSHGSLNHHNKSRAKEIRKPLTRHHERLHQERIRTMAQEENLLQELLSPGDIHAADEPEIITHLR